MFIPFMHLVSKDIFIEWICGPSRSKISSKIRPINILFITCLSEFPILMEPWVCFMCPDINFDPLYNSPWNVGVFYFSPVYDYQSKWL